ncbi:MAG: hypothetical protein ACUVUD_04465 [bacterium]
MWWFDWMALAVVLGGGIIQTLRTSKAGGMGLTLFEFGGLIVAALGAVNLSGSFAQVLGMQRIVMMVVLFIVFSVIGFVIARWFFGLTGWSFESLDGFFGFVWGVGAGVVVAHMVLRVMIESQGPNGSIATNLVNAPIAREVFYFKTWNALLNLLFKAKLGPDFNPDVN